MSPQSRSVCSDRGDENSAFWMPPSSSNSHSLGSMLPSLPRIKVTGDMGIQIENNDTESRIYVYDLEASTVLHSLLASSKPTVAEENVIIFW